MKRELELYIHVPFCESKCHYCDFLSFKADAQVQQQYVARLCRELRTYQELAADYELVSIFFGGGTPSILPGHDIEMIMELVRDIFAPAPAAEITLEANPGTLTADKLKSWQRAGVNRLSLGLQSASDEELQLLGRIHTWQEFRHSYELARAADFRNINIDLMAALPGQSVDTYVQSLRKVLACEPEHISAYSLIVEPDTPFYEQYGEDSEALPSEETERQMYVLTKQILLQYGYERYEISNYARPGYECQHNIGYWTRREYIGAGLGASSLIRERRRRNTAQLDVYLDEECSIIEDIRLTRQEQMEEFMFLGLRMCQGVSAKQFRDNFGVSIESVYKMQLQRLQTEQLLVRAAGWYRLTERGLDLSNYVFQFFLLDNNIKKI